MEEKISTHDFTADPLFHNGTVNSALTRIQNTLNYNLKEQYGIEDPEVTEKFMKLHGLSKDHFDFINNFETLVENGISDNSVDTNANKASTSITGFFAEAAMPINKLVGYRYLYRKLKELYGKKRAKYLTGELYDMSLAMADSTNLLKPYCYSLNASKLIYEGKPWGTLPSLPPQHVRSYVANLTELIHQLSNHLAGAIAVGSFFLDIAHVMIYREKRTLSDLKTPSYRKDMENCLQSFIHSVNHLSRNSIESPFTNISIFDRTKLRALIGEDNMSWYFEKDDAIDGAPEEALTDCGDRDWSEYVIDIIMEIEDIYMDIMDAGDRCHDGRPITFPVSTVNISRIDGKNGMYTFAEPEFVDHVCKNHDIMRYNIYVSSGQKIASCCRLINDEELFELGGQVNSFGGAGLSLGSHRVVTINMRRISLECSSYEDYKNRLKERMDSAADILVAHRALIKDMIDRGTQPFMDNGWLDLGRMFSTFGIMGYYEASKDLEKRFGGDVDYLVDMLHFIDQYARQLTKEKKNIFNVEEIPGESMSVKLANSDRWLFGNEAVPEPLYANQMIPLWEDVTLEEKMKREALVDKCSGGGICHYSLGEKLTVKQQKKVIETALKYGCSHFALNPTYAICENDHYTFGKYDNCPKCGSKIIDNLSRTVGFFVRTSLMTTTKREEDFEKRNYKGV